MTAKELKRLSRSELLEMLLELSEENEQLRQQLEEKTRLLQDKTIKIEEAGSLAEAAARLVGMFETAQAVCDLYTQNVQFRCRQMEESTREECDRVLAEAKQRGRVQSRPVSPAQDDAL